MNDELGQLYQQIETANRHKSQFLANVNQELRTPVSAIIGYGSASPNPGSSKNLDFRLRGNDEGKTVTFPVIL